MKHLISMSIKLAAVKHAEIASIVVGIDDLWCASSDASTPDDKFPYWLYTDSTLRYVGHLFNWRAIEQAFRRIKIGLGWSMRNREDGFADYEPAMQLARINQRKSFAQILLNTPGESTIDSRTRRS